MKSSARSRRGRKTSLSSDPPDSFDEPVFNGSPTRRTSKRVSLLNQKKSRQSPPDVRNGPEPSQATLLHHGFTIRAKPSVEAPQEPAKPAKRSRAASKRSAKKLVDDARAERITAEEPTDDIPSKKSAGKKSADHAPIEEKDVKDLPREPEILTESAPLVKRPRKGPAAARVTINLEHLCLLAKTLDQFKALKMASRPDDRKQPLVSTSVRSGPCFRTHGFIPISAEQKMEFVTPKFPLSDFMKAPVKNQYEAKCQELAKDYDEQLYRKACKKLNKTANPFLEKQLLRNAGRITFALSKIHNWGVYATETIPASEYVIEYQGVTHRRALETLRENQYQARGMDCYLFTVGKSTVDATVKGNIARLINHSCTPNCDIEKDEANTRVFIRSLREIQPGEELCYDYKFPKEDEDRIPCLCGTAQCRGYLN